MAQKRYINTKFWSDPFIQGLKTDKKLFYLYLFTNEHTNILGIYEITILTISFETGISPQVVQKYLDSLLQSGRACYKDNYIILLNFIKNQVLNPSVIKGMKREWCNLPLKLQQFILNDDRLGTDWVQTATYLTKLNLTKPNLSDGELCSLDKSKNMDTIQLNELGEEIEDCEKIPKKYKNKRKLYSKIAVYYMQLVGKTGDVLRHFPACKEIFDLYIQEFPDDNEQEVEKEIKGRIDVANWHYNKINCTDWGLGKMAENWNKIMGWNKEKSKY